MSNIRDFMGMERTFWRYFRVSGEAPRYADSSLFSVKIHHGGRLHSSQGMSSYYKGGDVVYVDGDKMSITQMNYWAYDLGYQVPPLQFSFKEVRTGIVRRIQSDRYAVDICAIVCPRTKVVELYIGCLSKRRVFADDELEKFDQNLDHSMFLGCLNDDVEDDSSFLEGVTVQHDEVEVVEKISRKYAKGKGVVHKECSPKNAKYNKLKKILKRRYETRARCQSSRQPEVDSESSTDSDDPNFEGIRDSDCEIPSEEDDVEFDQNMEGDPILVNKFDEMGFLGEISDDGCDGSSSDDGCDGSSSDELNKHEGSSDDCEDKGRFPVRCRKRFSKWKEFCSSSDMKNPTFVLEMEFSNSKVLKQAIRKHSILAKKDIIFTTNTRHKVAAKCTTSERCSWRIYASSTDLDNPTIYIRTLHLEHKCSSIRNKVKSLTSPDDFVDEYYSKEAYMKAYEPIMHPISGMKEWEKIHKPIAPPLYKRQQGDPEN